MRVRSFTPGVVATLTVVLSGCTARVDDRAAADPVARGAYLAVLGGCGDCHTPLQDSPQGPRPDASKLLSGHPADLIMPPPPPTTGTPWNWHGAMTNTAFAGPWGVSYAINLTPDSQTGIGGWSEQQFVQALRTGKHLGTGRPILPPMPWPSTAHMTDADLSALFAYLRSIPAVVNQVPAAQIAAPPSAPAAP